MTYSYTLLVGSFKDRSNAETFADSVELLELDHSTRIVKVEVYGETRYRVTVGSFSQKADAGSLVKSLELLLKVKPIMIMVRD